MHGHLHGMVCMLSAEHRNHTHTHRHLLCAVHRFSGSNPLSVLAYLCCAAAAWALPRACCHCSSAPPCLISQCTLPLGLSRPVLKGRGTLFGRFEYGHAVPDGRLDGKQEHKQQPRSYMPRAPRLRECAYAMIHRQRLYGQGCLWEDRTGHGSHYRLPRNAHVRPMRRPTRGRHTACGTSPSTPWMRTESGKETAEALMRLSKLLFHVLAACVDGTRTMLEVLLCC